MTQLGGQSRNPSNVIPAGYSLFIVRIDVGADGASEGVLSAFTVLSVDSSVVGRVALSLREPELSAIAIHHDSTVNFSSESQESAGVLG
ncbi:hypothetical protein E0F15_11315 [Frankia sp. B2]|nr:hypothetical protein E0F15_11315 [Frankia sp. B2]